MTIRELEILLHIYKNNKEKCDEFCDRIVKNTKGAGERESIGAILVKMGLTHNPHMESDMDYFEKIMGQLQDKLG